MAFKIVIYRYFHSHLSLQDRINDDKVNQILKLYFAFLLSGKLETFRSFDTHRHRSEVNEMRSFVNGLPAR